MIQLTKNFRPNRSLPVAFMLCLLTVGCVSVDKNSEVKYEPTDPQAVDLIRVTPYRSYQKIGTVEAHWFDVSDTKSMYDSMRDTAASEGADAVIVKDEGTENSVMMGDSLWAQGTAIKYDGAK